MREIAQGLELCNINFMWVIRFSVGDKTSVEKTLPQDYLDKKVTFRVPIIVEADEEIQRVMEELRELYENHKQQE
ncbi:hypothetical protein CQW23_02273 [Capsicum baccatum]|uniref:Uncharacterized protein n=1 Tax=Capsicum baccatum TaxID=33114 RepID=A0A2G2XR11_CAPBA|nr:hypothetical protein CQW23_02273 [Capsicum baccatum]